MKNLLGHVLSAVAAYAGAATAEPFVVAHSMNYQGGVDLTSSGVPHNPLIYERSLFRAKDSDETTGIQELTKVVDGLAKGPMPTVLDIERWPTDSADSGRRDTNVQKLTRMVELVREIRPDMQYGFYSVLPHRVYWQLVSEDQHKGKDDWERDNRRAREDLANHVDAIFPSLYTFYEDRKGWELYAVETLKAAREFGKPVYCYLWPKFHDSNPKLKGHYLPPEYWRLELETCREHADGIVIWNNEPGKTWDASADWWRETVDFLEKRVK